MGSGAKAFGHPIHPALIVFPLGLLSTAVIFDIIRMLTDNPAWSDVSFYLIAAGVVGGLVAAVFGLIDWLAIGSGTAAKRTGAKHGLLNVVVVVLFAGSWLLRSADPANPVGIALALSLAGAALALYTGWLGAELVYRHRIGVEEPGTTGRA